MAKIARMCVCLVLFALTGCAYRSPTTESALEERALYLRSLAGVRERSAENLDFRREEVLTQIDKQYDRRDALDGYVERIVEEDAPDLEQRLAYAKERRRGYKREIRELNKMVVRYKVQASDFKKEASKLRKRADKLEDRAAELQEQMPDETEGADAEVVAEHLEERERKQRSRLMLLNILPFVALLGL